jgi:hypothetical protein
MHGAVIVIRERRAGMAGRLLPGADHFDRKASPACYLAVSTLATSGSVAAPDVDRPSRTSDMPCQSADEPVTQTRSFVSRHSKLRLA